MTASLETSLHTLDETRVLQAGGVTLTLGGLVTAAVILVATAAASWLVTRFLRRLRSMVFFTVPIYIGFHYLTVWGAFAAVERWLAAHLSFLAWMTPQAISIVMLGARPHSHEASTNISTLPMNRRTWPMRCVSQPVSGTEMALATAKLVMTQVPCTVLTPKSPEMAGSDTFAMEVSSTFMNVAVDSARVPSARALPVSGG